MEGILNQNVIKGLCLCMCAVACLTLVILLAFGFSSIEATEYGLDYSWISKTISPEIRGNGLFFIGIGHSFIRFPRNVITVECSHDRTAQRGPIQSRTLDGLEVVLEISFQYILQSTKLYELYQNFGKDYQQVIINVAVDVLTEETTKYTAYEFFWNRGKIKDDFQIKLDDEMKAKFFTDIQFFQLRSVDLPDKFEEAIQESEVKKQEIQKAMAEYNKVQVEVDTQIKSAQYQKNVTINLAEGEAQVILKQNQANVDSFTKLQNAQTDAYTKLKSSLSLDNQSLLEYIRAKLIKFNEGEGLVVGIKSPEP